MEMIKRTKNLSMEMKGQDVVGIKTWEGSIRVPLVALADDHWKLQRHERAKTQKQIDRTGGYWHQKLRHCKILAPAPCY